MSDTHELSVHPCTISAARKWVSQVHRRLGRIQGGLLAIMVNRDGVMIGCAIVGHPARSLMSRGVLSVTRVAVIEGQPNACSMLYGACARAARAMGASGLVTYTHADEPGTSLRASGWISDGMTTSETNTTRSVWIGICMSSTGHGLTNTSLAEVVGFILEGQRAEDIAEFLVSRGYTAKGALDRIAEAYQSLERRSERLPTYCWHISARMELYRKMVHVNDYPAALKCLQDIERLQRRGSWDQKIDEDRNGFPTIEALCNEVGIRPRSVNRHIASGKIREKGGRYLWVF